MSKGTVWNKGKRNGGGGPPPGTGYKEVLKKSNSRTQPEVSNAAENNMPTRIDRVERMNRENWVSKPARVKKEEKPDQS